MYTLDNTYTQVHVYYTTNKNKCQAQNYIIFADYGYCGDCLSFGTTFSWALDAEETADY